MQPPIKPPMQPPEQSLVQRGAMEFAPAPEYLDEVRHYRLGRVRAELEHRDFAGILLYDPINTRYATDTTNMQLWSMHNEQRYVLLLTKGPVILFEGESARHLAAGFSTIDEIRYATPWYYFAGGSRCQELAEKWADEIADILNTYGGRNRRLAVDRMGPLGVHELTARGFTLFDGFEVMELAREIKSAGEIGLMRCAIAACESGMSAMRNALKPGITENQLWAKLHETNIALGGEWIETRILTSGPRTNPWYSECSHRVIEEGDLVAFDTDLIGPYGYCADISRTWVCGDRPSHEQRRLYRIAHEQIEHNLALLKPGVSLREISERAWKIPDEFRENRYSCIGHGVGMADEYPSLVHLEDFASAGYDDVLRAKSMLCIESYIGASGGKEGVKLEQQVLITEDGYELLSNYPMETDWL